ncbi:hypothetical protein DRH14_01780 [Candidatus Shapirobacteria bacterium]|nr:MAG: hypothetical protein DRH14_01780 [Candidatus Shapirobacteria bacterium]
MFKKLSKLLLTIVLFFGISSPVLAGNDLVVNCTSSPSNCSVSPTNTPLFSEADVKPGFNFYQSLTVNITDLDEDYCDLTVTADNLIDTSNLASVLISQLSRDGILVKSFTISELSNPTFIETIPNNSSYVYQWKINMDENAGNQYQGQNLSFDIKLNFSCRAQPSSTPTPTPAPSTPTPVVNPTSGVILNELMPGPTDNQEWFEIYNSNPFTVILQNWQYDDIDSGGGNPRPLNITIPAYSFYVVEVGSGYFNNSGGDSVRLIDDSGTQVDIFSYTNYSSSLSWSRQSDNHWCLTDLSKGLANSPCPGGTNPAPTSPPSSSSYSCNDASPSTPVLESAIQQTDGSVLLSWTLATPVTHYLVAYGHTPGNPLYGNPNVGNTTSYTVSGLTAGAQYCFYVRAINGCMPGDASNEICVNASSTIAYLETTPPQSFQSGVLGETTEPEELSQESEVEENGGQVEGVQSNCQNYWLPILYIIAFFINILYLNKQAQKQANKSNSTSVPYLTPLILPAIAFLIDTFMLKSRCCRICTVYCHYFWIGNILSYLIPIYYYKKTK